MMCPTVGMLRPPREIAKKKGTKDMSDTENETTQTDTETLSKRLKAAGRRAEKDRTERRARAVKGSHLTAQLVQAARDRGLDIEDKSVFHKITKPGSRRAAIYVAIKGGRADIAGLQVEALAIRQISEDEARAKHLGKVRGSIDFERTDEEVLASFGQALDALLLVADSPAKVTKAKKEKPADDTAEAQTTEAEATPEPEAAAG